jgi:quercetin dioxygenase-like cupin family protein
MTKPDTSSADNWAWPESLDAMQAAPEHHRVLLENEHVRVLESWVAPGDTVPVHTHRWPGVLHVLSWSDFVRYSPAGAVVLDSRHGDSAPQPGTVLWGNALSPHSLKNVGASELRIVTVEVKHARD